jgi:glycosyltransferase involved in cell wall biosynthesis
VLGDYYFGNPSAVSKEQMNVWVDDGLINYLGTTDDVKSVISKHDCIVLPSYREGLSRVLLEAASMAKPIIASDVPGCKDVIINNVTGFLCEPRDANSLWLNIQKYLLLSDLERREMGRLGRNKIILEFNESIVIKKYLNSVKTILR